MADFIVGNLAADAHELGRRGWIVGSFFAPESTDGIRHSDSLEVKYWRYAAGAEHHHPAKQSLTTEWTLVLRGRTRAQIGDSTVHLIAGDYVLIHPGTPNNLVAVVLEDVEGVTVKAPSDPKAKRVIGKLVSQ